MSGHVFISYSRSDKSLVRQLYDDLIKAGVDCWLDIERIPSGADWDSELQKAIEACEHFIIVCTPASMDSQNVKAEWQYAFELKKSLHPVILEPCNIPFRLQIYQHTDATASGYAQALQELIEVLPRAAAPIHVSPPVSAPASTELDALIQRAVANCKTMGTLLDRNTFNHIDRLRDQIGTLDSAALELLFLSAAQYRQSLDHWGARLKRDSTALDHVENLMIDRIGDTISYQRQSELATVASESLVAKVAHLLHMIDDAAQTERLLDALEWVLLRRTGDDVDLSAIETILLERFRQSPAATLARALGWMQSAAFLDQSFEHLAGKTFRDMQNEPESLYLHGLAYMTGSRAVEYLDTLTPEGFGFVPAGWFTMGGGSPTEAFNIAHEVFVPSFWLAKTPVTQADYARFRSLPPERAAPSRVSPKLPPFTAESDRARLPVHNVSWQDARLYARHLGQALGLPVDLPSEAMWEKAATWNPALQSKQRFPWGDELDTARANTIESGLGRITPVDRFSPQADSPYGMQDMAGNLWEWTSSEWVPYPYHPRDGREEPGALRTLRVLRGSSYYTRHGLDDACTTRVSFEDNYAFHDAGFRVALVVAR